VSPVLRKNQEHVIVQNTNGATGRHRKYFSIRFEYITCRIALDYSGVTCSFDGTTDSPEQGRGRMVSVKELMSYKAPISLLLSYVLRRG